MSGILFFNTRQLAEVTAFYQDILDMDVWLKQADCTVLKHGNLLLGFCQRLEAHTQGMITLFYEHRRQIDAVYQRLDTTIEPRVNERYRIYHFFAQDPEERVVECQCFLHSLPPYHTGQELLNGRRSIRTFTDAPVTNEAIRKLLEDCRMAPTSMNTQSYYFVVIRDRDLLEYLAGVRGMASAPIKAAPAAVAICADGERSKRADQDSAIAAYHFMLAAWDHGLGTCWIADMNREEIKHKLAIPTSHHIATITPLGVPSRVPKPGDRRPVDALLRTID